MRIIRSERRAHYTIVDNVVIRDSRLSFRARGLLIYLLSLPDNWTTNYHKLAEVAREGESAIRAALAELEACGYLERRKVRDPATGRWSTDAIVYESPRQRNWNKRDNFRKRPGGTRWVYQHSETRSSGSQHL